MKVIRADQSGVHMQVFVCLQSFPLGCSQEVCHNPSDQLKRPPRGHSSADVELHGTEETLVCHARPNRPSHARAWGDQQQGEKRVGVRHNSQGGGEFTLSLAGNRNIIEESVSSQTNLAPSQHQL